MMDDLQFTPERWLAFWSYFKGLPHQKEAVELLRQHLSQSDPALLTDAAEWVAKWREVEPGPAWPLTKEQLGEIMGCLPRYLPDDLMDDLAACCRDFHINTPLRLAYFLGQIGTESAGLRYPVEIASGSAYEGRSDLGNTHAGDGVKFAGTGFIQVTGRHNHQMFADYLAKLGKPDPKIMGLGKTYTAEHYAWSISGHWWFRNGMNEMCDGRPDIDRVGQRVNGVYPPRGAESRRAYTHKAFKVLGV